jgi:hypothetical protein
MEGGGLIHREVEGCRDAGRQGGRDAGRQGGREAGRQGGRDAGRQEGREQRVGSREAGSGRGGVKGGKRNMG